MEGWENEVDGVDAGLTRETRAKSAMGIPVEATRQITVSSGPLYRGNSAITCQTSGLQHMQWPRITGQIHQQVPIRAVPLPWQPFLASIIHPLLIELKADQLRSQSRQRSPQERRSRVSGFYWPARNLSHRHRF